MAIECTATSIHSATWDGTDGTINWTITNVIGDTPTIIAGQGTQTVTVQSISSATVSFTLNATVTGVNGPVLQQEAVVHTHTDLSPNYIGPDVTEQFVVQGQALNTIQTFNLFTGDNLVFSLEGAWPAALVIGAANGEITGTATDPVASYTNLTVRATNAYGFADSTPFTVTVTAGATAPVFTGPVPDQLWQVGVPIAQLAMSGFFTGTLPITYTIEAGTLPGGITMNTAGQINGTATVDGNSSFSVRATNASGFAISDLIDWTVWETVSISTIPDQTFPLNELYTHDMSQYVTGTVAAVNPYQLGANWPPGFSINQNTGVVTGTATVDTTYTAMSIGVATDHTPAFVISNAFDGIVQTEIPPAFYALTPDETTYEMLGVSIGTGGLTTTHTSDLYAPDYEGVYRGFVANEPVWSGGRTVKNWLEVTDQPDLWPTYFTNFIQNTVIDSVPCGEFEYDQGNDGGAVRGTIDYTDPAFPTADDLYDVSVSVKVRTVSGSRDMRLRLSTATPGYETISISDTWTRITMYRSSVPRAGLAFVELYPAQGNTDVFNIYMADWQLEFKAGDSKAAIPSEYVATSAAVPVQKVFASTNGNTVLANVVTEAVGTPLAEVPYLQYYPAAQNEVTYSNDGSNWSPTGSSTNTFDQVGLSGEPNTATEVSDTSNSALQHSTQNVVTVGNEEITVVLWVEKTLAPGNISAMRVNSPLNGVQFDPFTGDIMTHEGTVVAFEMLDVGGWWKVMMQYTNTAVTSNQLRQYPAWTTVLGGGFDSSLTGSIVIGNSELHLNKTIAQVRGLGPIFTTTAAVATDVTQYTCDIANNDPDLSSWYMEFTASDGNPPANTGILAANDTFVGYFATTGTGFKSRNSVGVILSKTPDELAKLGLTYSTSDNEFTINCEGVINTAAWSSYTGPAIYIGSPSFGGNARQFRNLQRYDITSYAEGKGIIDDLMLDTLKMVSGTTAGEIGYSAPSESNYGTLTPDTSFGFTILELYEKNGDLILIVDGTQLQSIYDHITWLDTDFVLLSADTFSTAGGVSTWTWLNAGISPTSATNYDILVQVDQS